MRTLVSRSLLALLLCGAAGPSAAQSFSESPYAVTVALPACATSDPEVRIIDSSDDWAAVNDPGARIFCVRPGNYTAIGKIRLTASGVSGHPRVIRYHDPTTSSPPHPVRLASAQRAVVHQLELRGTSNWLVHGLTVQGSSTHGVFVVDSSDNVLDHLLVQDTSEGLFRVGGLSHRNVIQNSVIRRTRIAADDDRGCLVFGNPGVGQRQEGNRVVHNELYDCTDGIQLHLPSGATEGGYFPGLVIDNNDIYLSTARHTNCYGVLDPKGPCGCAENGIDVKIAGTGSAADQVVSITENRVWGWRETDHGAVGDGTGRCGGSGSHGDLLGVHTLASYVALRGNRVFDGPRGLGIGNGTHHVVVTDNVFHGLDEGWSEQGYAIAVSGADHEIRRNVFVQSNKWLAFTAPSITGARVTCNEVLGSGHGVGQPGAGSVVDYNAYYGTTQHTLSGPHDLVYPQVSHAPNAPLCFWRKRWTAPERVCLSYGTYTVPAAHAGVCAAAPSPPARAAPQAPVLLGP
jgi:hypothetical protein